ncbi:hypothetical protein [Streptomyces sp. NPDC016626]|uniref:hypothetical protein n=1 Tax=Streptomyces sp. NPDC016626 TaxID=3364968 RepID=UPI0036F8B351
MSGNLSEQGRTTGARPDADTDEAPPAAESPGGLAIGELTGGAVAAGPRAEAEDSGRQIGRPADGGTLPFPVVPPLPGGITIGRMTGGAAATGPDARATHQAERFLEVTPELVEALALLPRGADELSTEAALAEEEIQATGGVGHERLRRLLSLTTQAAGSVGTQTAAAVAAGAITGMLA